MSKTIFLYLIALILISGSLKSQLFQPPYKHYTTEQGLAGSEVYQCLQDSKGFIWLATSNGISKYDGKKFTNFTSAQGLPDNTILYIVGEDKQGTVWFLSMSMDLIGISYNQSIINHPANNELKKIFQSSTNILPSIGMDGSFYFNMIVSGKCVKLSPDNKIHDINNSGANDELILIKTKSRFIIQTNEKAFKTPFIIKSVTIKNEQKKIKTQRVNPALSFGHSPRFIFDKNKLICITDNVLYLFNDKSGCLDSVNIGARIIDVFVDAEENILVSTHLNGVFIFNNSDIKSTPLNILDHKSIGRIVQDSDGAYWIPSLKDGVFYVQTLNDQAVLFKDVFQSYSVEKMVRGKNDLILAVSNGEVFRWHKNSLKQIDLTYKANSGKAIFQSIHYDSLNDRYLVSTDHASIRIIKNGEVINHDNNAGAILSFASTYNECYLGNWACIRKVDPLSLNVISTTSDKFKIRADVLSIHSEDSVFVGSIDGLYLYNPKQITLEHLKNKIPLLGSRIRQMIKVGNYYLLATKKDGIIYFPVNDPKKANKYTSLNGLASDNVTCIGLYNNEIWVSTNAGINRFKSLDDILNNKNPKLYTIADGLLTNEITAVAVLDKKIFACSNQGLSILDFTDYDASLNKWTLPRICIYSFSSDTTLDFFAGEIVLPKHNNFFGIKYSGIYFHDPNAIKVQYKLDDADSRWRTATSENIEYSNLAPGEYTLSIRISHNNGLQWTDMKQIKIIVVPYFYQTWWFILLLIITGLILIYYLWAVIFFRTKLRKLKRIRAQTRLSNMELKALRAQMNPHFIFNVISSIQNYVLDNDSKSAYKYLATFSKLIRNVLNNSEKKDIKLKDEIAWLEQYIELEKMRFKDRFDFKLFIDEYIDIESTYVPSMIIQPLIENSIKHGFSGATNKGLIQLFINKEQEQLEIIVEDNGVGINHSQKEFSKEHISMATRITKERINAYNELYLQDKIFIYYEDISDLNPNKTGTRITIYIK